ncbi:hypothetical protein CHLNCDRAFT_142700 [Chlorella variabilis]|uniref:Uncharacterized protein n=1 Tax=Chlorella variabilis TaxID=554065 RepID=E1Z8I4_CHLVA|nr:hypothetical protein CHLNCDRAFT_142700 [Chlorella variabilis]EFN57341.1 hypothetical protein CHLNCDRAFT_142700 [Chlorella variabilis]|eukprot:XP_005849443.1 hypothetical protein CHLNCDRAFT_142700 [Chlorella variabilis]
MSQSAEHPHPGPQQQAQAPVPPPAPAALSAPAASQDARSASVADQSAINAYDMMLQEKERVILQSIAKKRSKIQEVEKQLSELQLALHVNVGPRRQALEHLRSLIEQQNHQLDAARTNFRKAKQEMEHWQKQMEEAQQRKDLLAGELNTLVQQSAGAQLKKLEQLSEELEHLTEGTAADIAAAANGRRHTSGNGEGVMEQQQQQQQQRRLQQQQHQAAADARGRHVQLLPGRKAGGGSGRVSATRIAAPPSGSPAATGPFQGFE